MRFRESISVETYAGSTMWSRSVPGSMSCTRTPTPCRVSFVNLDIPCNHTLFSRQKCAGEEVSKRTVTDTDWKTVVPDGAMDEIERLDGVNRVKETATDQHSH